MARETMQSFYNSRAWRNHRTMILARDHYTCTEPNCMREATEVHHIVELNEDNVNDWNIAFNPENLRSLCHDCHNRITKEMKEGTFGILKPITFDSNGNPIVCGM